MSEYRKVTVRKMGGSVGITLPKEVADRLRVSEGETVYLVDTPDGVLVRTADPEFERVMEAYEKGARRYRNALRELAE
jgi:putative addiction module antidote